MKWIKIATKQKKQQQQTNTMKINEYEKNLGLTQFFV